MNIYLVAYWVISTGALSCASGAAFFPRKAASTDFQADLISVMNGIATSVVAPFAMAIVIAWHLVIGIKWVWDNA